MSCSGDGNSLNNNQSSDQNVTQSNEQGGAEICVDTFPHQDGLGWNGEETCALDGVVLLDPQNPLDYFIVAIEPIPKTEPIVDEFNSKQVKVSYANGATIIVDNDPDSIDTWTAMYMDSQANSVLSRIDENGRLHRAEFSDGSVVDYKWIDTTLQAVTLVDAVGGQFYFLFVDGRLYQSNEIGIANSLKNAASLRNSRPAQCTALETACRIYSIYAASSFLACSAAALVSAGTVAPVCGALGVGFSIVGVVCVVVSETNACESIFPDDNEDNENATAQGSWCTVTRSDGKLCTNSPYSACQIQHSNWGEPSPFQGYSQGDYWWSKKCEWEKCPALARPDCTLILPGTVTFECENPIEFEREYPNSCVSRR